LLHLKWHDNVRNSKAVKQVHIMKTQQLPDKHKGQPRGERRAPERTGERRECALRRAHEGRERAAAGPSGSAAGIENMAVLTKRFSHAGLFGSRNI